MASYCRSQDVMALEPLSTKWEAFGWHTQEINGHNFDEIRNSFSCRRTQRPSIIIAHTIKGKGVSFMEDDNNWHYRIPNPDELSRALNELTESLMRDTFARVMTQLAQEREDIVLLSGDIGNRMFDGFKDIAPTRFLNCGIAESNMMSVAAGMASQWSCPVVYTITPFTTTRCLEQIKIGVAYHQAPVLIVGTDQVFLTLNWACHHSLEDMAITRNIPGLNVVAPADSVELEAQLREALNSDLPTYSDW